MPLPMLMPHTQVDFFVLFFTCAFLQSFGNAMWLFLFFVTPTIVTTMQLLAGCHDCNRCIKPHWLIVVLVFFCHLQSATKKAGKVV